MDTERLAIPRPQRSAFGASSDDFETEVVMQKRFTALLAIAVGVLLIAPATAQADQRLRGEMDLSFNLVAPECAGFTWVGTIDFHDAHGPYGMAFVPLVPPRDDGLVVHFSDMWLIYDAPEMCPSGEPVMWGFDKGVQSNRSLQAVANGKILGVNSDFFDDSMIGRNVHWSGVSDVSGYPALEFGGPFRMAR